MRFGLTITVGIISLLLVGTISLGMRLSLTDGETEVAVAGMLTEVIVSRDRFGIPDIVAQSKKDAVRALGYVTARDRLFQIDLLRRKSAGRLAEIFGSTLLTHDKKQRVYVNII